MHKPQASIRAILPTTSGMLLLCLGTTVFTGWQHVTAFSADFDPLYRDRAQGAVHLVHEEE